jgi:PAS domain S-box-containing protein
MTTTDESRQALLDALPCAAAIVGASGLLGQVNRRWAGVSIVGVGGRIDEAAMLEALASGVDAIQSRRQARFQLDRVDIGDGRLVRADLTAIESPEGVEVLMRLEPLEGGMRNLAPGGDNDDHFQAVANTAAFLIWTSDATGQTTFVSNAWLEVTGRRLEDEIGEGWRACVHPDDVERCVGTYESSFARRVSYEIEYRLRQHDGEYIWVHSRASPRYGLDGEFVGYVGACIDIQSRRLPTEAYRGVFDAGRDAMIVLDDQGVVVDVNPAACLMYGFSHDEFVGLTSDKFIDDSSQPNFKRFVQTVRQGEPFHTIGLDKRKDGTRFDVEVHGTRMIHRDRVYLLGQVRDVTERLRAESELKQLGEAMDAVLHQFPIVFFRINENGTIVESVGEGLGAIGLGEEELVGANVFERFPDLAEPLRLCLAGERQSFLSEGETESQRWVFQTYVMPDEARGSGLIGVALDISDRERAKRALEESEQHLREVAAQVPGVVYCYDMWPDSSRHTIFMGTGLEDLLGKRIAAKVVHDPSPLFDRMTAEGRELCRRSAQSALELGRPIDVEYALRHDDGRWVRVRNLVRTVRMPNGNIRNTGVIIDVTANHRAEVELKESRELLHQTQRLARIGGWKMDLRTNETVWTDEVFHIFGFSEDVNPSFSLVLELCDQSTNMSLRAALRRAIHLGNPWVEEIRVRLSDGRREHVRVTGEAQMENGRPVALLGTFQDVTRQRELESELRHAQKMEAVGQLAAGIAHEFNNLVSAILTQVEIARSSIPTNGQASDSLNQVIEATDQVFGLTRGLLAFARKAPARRELVSIDQIIEQVDRLLRRTMPRRIDLDVRPTGKRWILADQAQIVHVLLNLALNARDAMPAGGSLTISVESETPCEAPLYSRPRAAIRVSDTGVGVDPAHISELFDPFFTTKPPGEGTGLGLSLCKSIVEEHGGEVTVESCLGKGTTFTVYLPIRLPPSLPREVVPTTRPLAVLVEPAGFTRSLLTTMLSDQGFRVDVASTVNEALERAPDTDGLVVSLHEDCAEAIRQVERLERGPDSRPWVVLIADAGRVRRGSAHPGVAIVERPFRAADLKQAIGEAGGRELVVQ